MKYAHPWKGILTGKEEIDCDIQRSKTKKPNLSLKKQAHYDFVKSGAKFQDIQETYTKIDEL